MERKPYICPMLIIANAVRGTDTHCIGRNCAWFDQEYYYAEKDISIGECALLKIAQVLE